MKTHKLLYCPVCREHRRHKLIDGKYVCYLCDNVHVHHWIIETPDGDTSPGICQDCGATAEFKNSMPAKFNFTTGYKAYSNREVYLGKRETLYQTVWGSQ